MDNIAIGIDLGTTNSCVGVFKNNKVMIIQNNNGKNVTPSMIGFNNYDRVKGNAAKNIFYKNYKRVIYDVKRLIGRRFSDKEVQNDMKYFPFKVIKNELDEPMIEIEYIGKIRKMYPEQISAMLLDYLKEISIDYIGKEIKDIVISVPARFNDSQRQSTIDACKIAKLNVLKIINEPTAAAIAYFFHEDVKDKRNICVFDLGGGTFDITILEIDNNKFIVKATGGDSHLGGEDFDNKLVDYCAQKFKEENNIDLFNYPKAIRRLKIACEELKTQLSFQIESNIDLDSLVEGIDFFLRINRGIFEELCNDLFEKCIEKLKETLKSINMENKDIKEILLVGGSSRIPKIQELLKENFNNIKINIKINPDEAVALGAGYEAARLKNLLKKKIEIIDVNPHSLGISSKNGLMSVIIKKCNPIPCDSFKLYKTIEDNQSYFGIGIYEGENKEVANNYNLDNFIINIRKAPKGKVLMKVTFHINENSILEVIAEEIDNNNNLKKLVVNRGRKSKFDLNSLIKFEEELIKEEKEQVLILNTKDELRKKIKDILGNEKKNSYIYQIALNYKEWLQNSQNVGYNTYKLKIEELNINSGKK